MGDAAATHHSRSRSDRLGDLHWLVRYARHCGFTFSDCTAPELALRSEFGKAAWRIVCRSPKDRFVPILRHRDLSLESLITYCQRLAKHSFVIAPQAILLAYFVDQRRLFQDRPCRVPIDEDYAIIRVADREANLTLSDIARVTNWSHRTDTWIRPQHKWPTLVRLGRQHEQAMRVQLTARRTSSWYFYCGAVAWRGYQVEPLTDAAALWNEGQALGNCLYQLRKECVKPKPSRFFSIRRDGKRVATLELTWRPPQAGDTGMDRELGVWQLQDLRRSYNRLPGDHLLNEMQAFTGIFNAWAKRPRRRARVPFESNRQISLHR